ncbi:hypothetical protein CDL15_Pgr020180 [Punica granatum]|uniref:Retrovirus-related Pol polyprotein from transposon TNT 1-94-like beta-barrel domain-containing protein n=1 Tax=Punica granatum TaxID=22663 RepID=A0A218VRB2_PUNGR|nr:hypothetical protein CDL15_Pgr020180 [Punica granatum]
MYSNLSIESSNRIIDTGASLHLTGTLSHLLDSKPIEHPHPIWVSVGRSVNAKRIGRVQSGPDIMPKDVLYVPEFTCNLISVRRLAEDLNCSVSLFANFCVRQDLASRRLIGACKLQEGSLLLRVCGIFLGLERSQERRIREVAQKIGTPSKKSVIFYS